MGGRATPPSRTEALFVLFQNPDRHSLPFSLLVYFSDGSYEVQNFNFIFLQTALFELSAFWRWLVLTVRPQLKNFRPEWPLKVGYVTGRSLGLRCSLTIRMQTIHLSIVLSLKLRLVMC